MARLTHTILAAAFTGALSVSSGCRWTTSGAWSLSRSADPVPMRGGTYRAVLSSFCLQQDHRLPSAADAYLDGPRRPDTVRLVGHDAARATRLIADDLFAVPSSAGIPRLVLFPEAAFGVVTFTKLTVHGRRTLHSSLLARSKIQHYRKPLMRTEDGAPVLRRGGYAS